MAATKTISTADVTFPDGEILTGVEVRVANNVGQVFVDRSVVREMAVVSIYATSRNEFVITGADGTLWQVRGKRRCCGG